MRLVMESESSLAWSGGSESEFPSLAEEFMPCEVTIAQEGAQGMQSDWSPSKVFVDDPPDSMPQALDAVNPEASYQVAASRTLDAVHRRSESLVIVNFKNNFASYKTQFCPPVLPCSNESDHSEGVHTVVRDEVLTCMNVASARHGDEVLWVCNPVTGCCVALPPLNRSRHPVLIHLISGDPTGSKYKVVVAGSGLPDAPESHSVMKTEEFSSTTGLWKCTGDVPGPSYALNDYQTGVHYKSPESGNEFICCVAVSDHEGNKGVAMYDLQESQWEDSSKRPLPVLEEKILPHFESSGGVDTNPQLVGCGGSILLVSLQENARVKDICIHQFFPEKAGSAMWKLVIKRHQGTSNGVLQEGVQGYPVFTGYLTRVIRSATVVQCGELVILLTEQEVDEVSYMFIHMLTFGGSSGARQWEEIYKRKFRGYRGPTWTTNEINAYVTCRVEVSVELQGQELWTHLSKRLKEDHGIIRSPDSCKNLSDTLKRRYNKIRAHLTSNDIQRESSAWDNFWQRDDGDASKNALLKDVDLECYNLMDQIERGKKPRKKTGESSQMYDTDGASTVLSRSLHDTSGPQRASPMPAPPLAPSTTLAESLKDLKAIMGANAKIDDGLIEIRKEEIKLKEKTKESLELKTRERDLDTRERDLDTRERESITRERESITMMREILNTRERELDIRERELQVKPKETGTSSMEKEKRARNSGNALPREPSKKGRR